MATSTSFYIGPTKGRLVLDSWDAVVTAAAAGLLDETHWVELKEAVPAKSKGANLELARDLASLSVDGGLLVIGVTDPDSGEPEVVGTTEVGPLIERVVSVAQNIHPPLHVEVDRLPHPADETEVVLVRVPASASAPHMVDHRYWGRSDSGKTKLSDPEVSRLFNLRRSNQEDFSNRLRDARSRDLVPEPNRRNAHGYLVLRPIGYDPTFDNHTPIHSLSGVIKSALANIDAEWPPSMYLLDYSRAHADGLMVVNRHLEPDADDRRYLQALLRDDGQLEVASGEISSAGSNQAPDAERVIQAGHVLELTHSVILVASYIGEHHLGHWGQWEAGVYFTDLKGLYSSRANTTSGSQLKPFATDEHTRTTLTTTQEMRDQPAQVVTRLVRAFIRGLGHDDIHFPYVEFDDIYKKVQQSQ